MTTLAPLGVQAYLGRSHCRPVATAARHSHRRERAGAGVVTATGWLAEIQRRWPVSRTARVSAILAGLAEQSGSLTVTLDPAAVHRLLLQAHVLPPGLRRILHRLTACGMLAHTPSQDPLELGSYTLTLPAGLGTVPPGEATGNGAQT